MRYQPLTTWFNRAVTFMVTRPPIDPVRLVHEICLDTEAGNKRTRWAQRFTPIQSTCYANLPDFRVMCEKVLGPIFHAKNVAPIKVFILYYLADFSMRFVQIHGITHQ
jgi:tRNA acetyltransferase TAN1